MFRKGQCLARPALEAYMQDQWKGGPFFVYSWEDGVAVNVARDEILECQRFIEGNAEFMKLLQKYGLRLFVRENTVDKLV